MKITKQSLNRVLDKLMGYGFVEQVIDTIDKRKKLLRLTKKGVWLENELTTAQIEFIERAYKFVGTCSSESFNQVLLEMMPLKERKRYLT